MAEVYSIEIVTYTALYIAPPYNRALIGAEKEDDNGVRENGGEQGPKDPMRRFSRLNAIGGVDRCWWAGRVGGLLSIEIVAYRETSWKLNKVYLDNLSCTSEESIYERVEELQLSQYFLDMTISTPSP